jgi:signal transduction histidine kinase
VPAVVDAMDQIGEGTAMDIEYRVDERTEYSRWVWVQANPIIEDGEVVRIAGFSRDVTDRRRRERQLVVMDNLLRHNIRNDLNVILGQAESIEEESLATAKRTNVIQRTARKLLASAQKQREIIDLLTDRSPGLERIDLRAVAEEMAREVQAEYTDVSVDVSGVEDTDVRACSELPLALLELLENVAEHSGTDYSEVQVEVRRTGENAEFVVTDDLPPIPDIEANVLRGNHDMDAIYHSSGLGFWLVYWCVELSNGDIDVASAPGGGNSIVLSLPLVE